MRTSVIVLVATAVLIGTPIWAQTGEGSLRGYVKDEQGGVLPGVAITATSPELLGQRVAVTDPAGYYRLVNLAPGEYKLTAQLEGFATFVREQIIVRAGATFAVDVVMRLGTLKETVVVKGESPMLEVSSPSHELTIDGDFQRAIPVQGRKNWTDFLDLTTGVVPRPFDDNSGRILYFGHGTDLWANVLQIEGNSAVGYNDAQATYVNMSTDLIADVDVKIGGVPASEPMGTGLVINVVTKSGGDSFSGSAGHTLQPMAWNSDNTGGTGTPTIQKVNQLDVGFGGPIWRQKAWFFTSYRYADLDNGVSRTPEQVEAFKTLFPGWKPFDSETSSHQPYLKLTGQVAQRHNVNAYWQHDRLEGGFHRSIYYEPISIYATGGDMFGAKVTSVWGNQTTTQLAISYNNKSGADEGTWDRLPGHGPQLDWHRSAFLSGGRLVGTGSYGTGGNLTSLSLAPASSLIFRGDLTRFQEGWAGSHEFKVGIYGAPWLHFDRTTRYVNDGFVYEELRLVDPENLGGGSVPFHRQYISPTEAVSLQARDRDIGVYVQDVWRPRTRLTLNLGVRADFVRRQDKIFNIDRMNTVSVGPRLGFSYMLTADARNVLRGSYGRVHEAVNGRDAPTSRSAGGGRVETRDVYDVNGDGVFETVFVTPALASALAGYEFDPDLHQPFTDEFILGYRRQFPWQTALDVAYVHRDIKSVYALVDVNGYYPESPGQPFGGFGRVDPTRGILYQQTNSSWDKYVYSAIEITATKNMTHGLQFLVGIHRQWQHLSGTWNPTDAAGFIQPQAYPNDKQIWMARGNYDHQSYRWGSFGGSYGPTWRKYGIKTAVTYLAPAGILLAANWSQSAGPWSGFILTTISASDPDVTRFGPATVKVVGGTQSNPLATTVRFKYATRGEGQAILPPIRTLNLKVGKTFKLGGKREVEISSNVLNVLNADEHYSYNYYGSTSEGNPNFLQPFIRQNARGWNAFLGFRF